MKRFVTIQFNSWTNPEILITTKLKRKRNIRWTRNQDDPRRWTNYNESDISSLSSFWKDLLGLKTDGRIVDGGIPVIDVKLSFSFEVNRLVSIVVVSDVESIEKRKDSLTFSFLTSSTHHCKNSLPRRTSELDYCPYPPPTDFHHDRNSSFENNLADRMLNSVRPNNPPHIEIPIDQIQEYDDWKNQQWIGIHLHPTSLLSVPTMWLLLHSFHW